jgi:hypothetical protein
MLLPLSRSQLIDGLLAAAAWNAAAFWLTLNFGLVILFRFTANDNADMTSLFMLLLLTATGAVGLGGLGLRVSVWPSAVKRLGVMMVSMFLFQAPLMIWALGGGEFGAPAFLIVATVEAGVGVLMARLARQAWLNTEMA